MGLQTYADEGIAARTTLSFNAGSRTTSVALSAGDYLQIEHATAAAVEGLRQVAEIVCSAGGEMNA